jgi:predicted GNAT superfamily acetyltransferase
MIMWQFDPKKNKRARLKIKKLNKICLAHMSVKHKTKNSGT